MKINLIQVPYHLGKRATGMGLGPIRFMETKIVEKLRNHGHQLKVVTIQLDKPFEDKISSIIDLNNLLKKNVQEGVKNGYFPLILGGNCNTCLGTLAGLNDPEMGIIWFDAHGDFNTPETTPSGFLDGMPFAIATGQCYTKEWSQIADIPPIKESHSLHIGGCDFDPEELDLIKSTEVGLVTTKEIKETGLERSIIPALVELHSHTEKIYLHIDMDVINPQEAPGVDFPSPDGLSSEIIEQIIRIISERFLVKAVALTAYNPTKDEHNKTLITGIRLLKRILEVIDQTQNF
ncbi:MAG: arginase family protein [Candidatus Hodarchaeota archaeon]